MGIEKFLNLRKLIEIYTVSNTPAYLYKNFRADTSIQDVATKFTTDQLIEEFLGIIEKNSVTIEDFVTLYAIYVSLTFKENDFDKVKEFFYGRGKIGNEWFSDIAEIFIKTYQPINIINVSGYGNNLQNSN